MKQTILVTVFFLIAQYAISQSASQWRGLNRDGQYPDKNLLTQWPVNGPEMLWFSDSLPKGYSSPTVDEQGIYLTGIEDTTDVVFALNHEGKLLWKTAFGRAWMNSFSDSRCTPAIDGDFLYVSSGYCYVACINKKDGSIVWQLDGFTQYEGKTGEWGYSESLVVIDDKVIFTPAGDKTTMVALDKLTGKEIWKSPALNDVTGYVSPLVIRENGMTILVNVLSINVVGINANDGSIVFTADYGNHSKEKAMLVWPEASYTNTNTPLYHNHELYVTSGYNHVGVKYKLSDDFKTITHVWTDSVLDVHHGGAVLVNGYIYGANWINNSKGNWCCIDWNTGECKYETTWQTKGSIIAAGNMLYIYDEKRGNIALVKATPEKFELVSEFAVTKGKGPNWSHLVIYDGKLYVRHEDALMVFNISQ